MRVYAPLIEASICSGQDKRSDEIFVAENAWGHDWLHGGWYGSSDDDFRERDGELPRKLFCGGDR